MCVKFFVTDVSINSVQKALDLTTPAKNRMRIIDLNFQIKKLIPLACRGKQAMSSMTGMSLMESTTANFCFPKSGQKVVGSAKK